MNRIVIVGLLLLLALIIFMGAGGCAPSVDGERNSVIASPVVSNTPANITKLPGASVITSVYRYVDEEAGVVCWFFNGLEKGGVGCLPISDTKLDPVTGLGRQ